MEQRKIIQDAARKNTMQSTSNNVNETIQANENLQEVVEMLSNLRKNKEPLLHSSIFIELKANSHDNLKELQSEVDMELRRSHIEVGIADTLVVYRIIQLLVRGYTNDIIKLFVQLACYR